MYDQWEERGPDGALISTKERVENEALISPTERARFIKVYCSVRWHATPERWSTPIGRRTICTVLLVVDWLVDLMENHYSQPLESFEAQIEVLLSVLWAHHADPFFVDPHRLGRIARGFQRDLRSTIWARYRTDDTGPDSLSWMATMKPFQGMRILGDDHQYLLDEIEDDDPGRRSFTIPPSMIYQIRGFVT